MKDGKYERIPMGSVVHNLIYEISRLVDQGEYEHNAEATSEARRLLLNQLPEYIDEYVKEERQQAFLMALQTQETQNLTSGNVRLLQGGGGG
jgi:hypothetical protein